ncbi:MAG: ATP phosphoribosyltransferase [Flavobacteriaceae bacterium TMED238]|nr:ATP phosphoribosyltransferase [Paracoccaceae bacterium]RPG63641.1 MAG: ATP phosphoribosyltransferase [Flavobacteriaceae bacterium TMED238]|tara:strand:- start:757 stop:1620 length:864 start_codon:yes stop_codon:yes gene_type:complete
MKNRLTIAIQKKGRLFDQSKDLIKKSGINFSTKGDNLLAKSNNLPIDILFVRSDDIPSLVSNGDADLAIVGENVLIEKSLFKRTFIEKIINLGFSKCRLSFAAPKNKKIKTFNNMKIATSYPNTVKKYLKDNKITASVTNIHGSVELTPYIGMSDMICDLVSSGATLEANNLKEIEVILESQAVLIKNKKLNKDKEKIADKVISRMQGVVDAIESKYVMLNVDSSKVKDICKLLPGSESPTIIPLEDSKKVAIHALCQEPIFWETMEKLKEKGASSILVMPVEKILN